MAIDWGLTVGGLGTAISAAGFAFTIQQLHRTAKATEAVRNAVSQLKNRMSTFDYASECVRAVKSLQHASRLLRLKQWQDAATTLLDAQVTLHRISVSNEGKDASRLAASTVAALLLDSVSELEEADEKSIDYDYSSLIMIIRKHVNILDSEIVAINRELYENA